MFKSFFKTIVQTYHDFLGLFFDFDVNIYVYKTSKIKTNKLKNFKYVNKVPASQLDIHPFLVRTVTLPKTPVLNYIMPTLQSLLVLRDMNKEFFSSIKLKIERLDFLCITKNYMLDLLNQLSIFTEFFILEAKSHKSLKKEIQISRKLQTIEEILEIEPYTKNADIKEILSVPVVKYPIKQEKFTELQIETMKTKLAIQAKCKKYSIMLDKIYDKIPDGMYVDFEIKKDNSLNCKMKSDGEQGALQFFVTGLRKYNAQTTQVLIKYSDLDFPEKR